VSAVVIAVALWSSAARATITQGDFSLFGYFETRESGRWGEGSTKDYGTQTTYEHPIPSVTEVKTGGKPAGYSGGSFDFNHWDLVQARQLASIRPDYHFVKNYKFLGRFDTLVLKDADFFAMYRPWYDAEGTLKNKGVARTDRDWYDYNHTTLQQEYFRDDLHEYYAQLNFTDNFSARVGKQQVIWSEADALSGTEVTNSSDLTYHWLHFESPEDLRKNVRMIKFNYILPDFEKTANNEIEAFIIPGDFQGDGLNVNLGDARNPWTAPAAGGNGKIGGSTGYNQNGEPFSSQTPQEAGALPMTLVTATGGGGTFFDLAERPYGNKPSNSLENSEFGMRISSLLPIGNGLQTSFIYLYEARDSKISLCSTCTPAQAGQVATPFMGSAGNAANWVPKPPSVAGPEGLFVNYGNYAYGRPKAGVPVAGTVLVLYNTDYRRNHFFDLTGTYYDKDLTDIVYRYDFFYAPMVGVAVANTSGKLQGLPKGPGGEWTEQSRWIIATDRPTYIPWISKQHTFLTFQNTVTWYPDRPQNCVANLLQTAGKVREFSDLASFAATDWLLNGQLTTLNLVAWDVDDSTGTVGSVNSYRYSRNVLFGVNAAWYLGRSGRWTDPYTFSRSQRINELEFTLTYEI